MAVEQNLKTFQFIKKKGKNWQWAKKDESEKMNSSMVDLNQSISVINVKDLHFNRDCYILFKKQ